MPTGVVVPRGGECGSGSVGRVSIGPAAAALASLGARHAGGRVACGGARVRRRAGRSTCCVSGVCSQLFARVFAAGSAGVAADSRGGWARARGHGGRCGDNGVAAELVERGARRRGGDRRDGAVAGHPPAGRGLRGGAAHARVRLDVRAVARVGCTADHRCSCACVASTQRGRLSGGGDPWWGPAKAAVAKFAPLG